MDTTRVPLEQVCERLMGMIPQITGFTISSPVVFVPLSQQLGTAPALKRTNPELRFTFRPGYRVSGYMIRLAHQFDSVRESNIDSFAMAIRYALGVEETTHEPATE